MPQQRKIQLPPLAVLAAIIAFYLVVYAPAIFVTYAFEDSYTVLADALQDRLVATIKMINLNGRPLAALYTEVAYGRVDRIGDLGYIRAFGVVGIGVVGGFVYRAFCQTRLPHAIAIAAALLFGLTPSFQVYAAWDVASPYPWACALAAASFAGCDWEGDPRPGWPRLCGSILLLTASLAIYQPAAMMFWTFAAIAWLLRSNLPLAKPVATAGTVMLASMVLEFGLLKIVPIVLYEAGTGYFRAALVENVMEKITWFLKEPLSNALNLFVLDPTIDMSLGVALILVSGFFLFSGKNLREALVRIAIAIVLIPASYVPNLLVAENWSSYRTLVALTGLILIYLVVALVGWARLLKAHRLVPAFCAVAVAAGALAATRNVLVEFAVPQAEEYQLVESALKGMQFNPDDQICFAMPSSDEDLAPTARYDEFGILSSTAVWVPKRMAWLIFREAESPSQHLFSDQNTYDSATTIVPGCKEIDLKHALNREVDAAAHSSE